MILIICTPAVSLAADELIAAKVSVFKHWPHKKYPRTVRSWISKNHFISYFPDGVHPAKQTAASCDTPLFIKLQPHTADHCQKISIDDHRKKHSNDQGDDWQMGLHKKQHYHHRNDTEKKRPPYDPPPY